MKTFIIDAENDITAFASAAEAKQAATEGASVFGTEQDLMAAADDWSGDRLVELWNSIPGVTPGQEVYEPKGGSAAHLESDPAPAAGRADSGTDSS